MEHMENQIRVRGSLQELPEFSHENHGRRFLKFSLLVRRLSGTADLVPVIAPEEILNPLDVNGGEKLYLEGQVRSHNVRKEDGRH